MSEAAPSGETVNGLESLQLSVKKIYVKDLSFESPNAPEIFFSQVNPEVNYEFNNDIKRLSGTDFEVSLRVTVTVQSEETVACVIECLVAGIFGIEGVSDEFLPPLLQTYCPATIYPYARELVADLSARGGFPAITMPHVDFAQAYQQQVAQAQASTDAPGPGNGSGSANGVDA